MTRFTATRTPPGRTRLLVASGLILAVLGTQACQSASSSSLAADPPSTGHPSASRVTRGVPGGPVARTSGPATRSDGVVPSGVTVFDDSYAAVSELDPDLLHALRTAAADASGEGITFYVNSGWRSPKYQNQLLHEAVSKYGSEKEAARWVATATTSAHVSGDAVDVGKPKGAAWLSEHGARYGLCQIYENEPWHYELRPGAVVNGCPARYADPTHDPRLN